MNLNNFLNYLNKRFQCAENYIDPPKKNDGPDIIEGNFCPG